jgi:hypothetical protein
MNRHAPQSIGAIDSGATQSRHERQAFAADWPKRPSLGRPGTERLAVNRRSPVSDRQPALKSTGHAIVDATEGSDT